MASNSFDVDYLKLMLQNAWKITFTHHKLIDTDLGILAFIYADHSKAIRAWDYVDYRLHNETIWVSLRITDKNELEILLDIREKKIKIPIIHTAFNAFDLAAIIDNGAFPFVDSSVHICCQYFDPKTTKEMPLMSMDGKRLNCISSGSMHRLDNDGFQFLPPPDIPSLF